MYLGTCIGSDSSSSPHSHPSAQAEAPSSPYLSVSVSLNCHSLSCASNLCNTRSNNLASLSCALNNIKRTFFHLPSFLNIAYLHIDYLLINTSPYSGCAAPRFFSIFCISDPSVVTPNRYPSVIPRHDTPSGVTPLCLCLCIFIRHEAFLNGLFACGRLEAIGF